MQVPTEVSTDEELATLASQGSQEAFTILYERYFDSIYDMATRLVRNPDAGADVVQTTFERALRELARNRQPERFKPWLFRIAHNVAMDHWRASRRTVLRSPVGEDEDRSLYLEVNTHRLNNPELVTRDKEIAGLVWQAASSLSHREYTLLDLYLRKGFEPEEIATAMGAGKGAIYTMLSRVRESLEGAVVALLLMQRGRRECLELDQLVQH